MTLTLGFSGGVMILVSFVELLPSGIDALGFGPANLAFFGGMIAMFLIDELIPHDYMGEHHHTQTENGQDAAMKSRLLKTGLFVALGVGIHNFPEGMASFATALSDPQLGIAIAIAIAHCHSQHPGGAGRFSAHLRGDRKSEQGILVVVFLWRG
jgi:ZIP family zinc transporter